MARDAIVVHQLSKRYRLRAHRATGSIYDSAARFFRGRPPEVTTEHMWALRDVAFEVPQGHVLGVIGRNGSGKSTLMRVLARVTVPTSGWAEVRGHVGALLQVGAGFHPELSGRDNIAMTGAILGMSRTETAAQFERIVEFAEIGPFLDTPVKFYSSGMYLRLAFSVSAFLRADIMLIDEVMAVGDAAFAAKSLQHMRDMVRGGRTVVYVSHSLDAVRSLCDSVLVLDRGTVTFHGPTTDAIVHYQRTVRTGS